MGGSEKPAANRSTLLTYKARIVGAKKGWGLLKKKRDALKTRFQAMLTEIIDCKKEVGAMVQDCAFSYAKAEYASESAFGQGVLGRVNKPSITCTMKADNCAGVQLPTFTCNNDPTKDAALESLGIGCGGQVIGTCREQHKKALELFIKMASLQTSFKTLDEEIKMTSRRVNALECVVIPRLTDIMAWVKQEMDEMEREEFFRVKKVVEKKKERHLRELEEEMAARKNEKGGSGPAPTPGSARPGAITAPGLAMPNILGNPPQLNSARDSDILF